MQVEIPITGPLDLRRTLRGLQAVPSSPAVRFDRRGAWRATRTAAGPATILLRRTSVGVAAEAWGPGAEAVLGQAAALVGAGGDPAFPAHDPVIERLQRRFRGIRVGRTGAVFEAVLPTVIAQKVTGKGSKESYRQLVAAYGSAAPGPGGLRVPPAPEVLADLPYEEYHHFGIERRRAEIVRFAAHRVGRLEAAATMPRESAYRRLTAFPGIGPWTAAKVAHAALGDADAVPVGDYNLPSLVTWNLAGEERGDDDRMLELLAPYRGNRGRVLTLLKAGGQTPPRYGPRLAVRRIEHY